jgi:hypothetical protein
MGVLGEMFPSRKLRSEAGEAGSGQGWRLGRVDLDRNVVELYVDPGPADAAGSTEDDGAAETAGPAGPPERPSRG